MPATRFLDDNNQFMKIYTKTGDAGQTSLFGGSRRHKDDLRIEAYGNTDELNASIGLLRDHLTDESLRNQLFTVQHKLFDMGSRLAVDPESDFKVPTIKEEDVTVLEEAIDQMEKHLPPLRNFVLPGGHPVVSMCHMARCICRRAERRVVSLSRVEAVPPTILHYLNRLSDYLFVLSRTLSQDLNAEEVLWKPTS